MWKSMRPWIIGGLVLANLIFFVFYLWLDDIPQATLHLLAAFVTDKWGEE